MNNGTAQQVREALYKTMDRFGNQAKDSFRKKVADLKKSNPPDLEAKTTALLNELNQKLKKNELNKEKARLHADLHSWRESASKGDAERNVQAKWVDLTLQQVLQQN